MGQAPKDQYIAMALFCRFMTFQTRGLFPVSCYFSHFILTREKLRLSNFVLVSRLVKWHGLDLKR